MADGRFACDEDVGGPRGKVRLALYSVADDAAAGAARDFVAGGTVEIGIAMAGWVALEQHGYGDRFGLSWEAVWNHPDNASLRQARRNPNVLLPGDVVRVPDCKPKVFFVETGKTHTFVLSRAESSVLDLVLVQDEKPRANEDCTVIVRGSPDVPATTDALGRLKTTIPAKTKRVTIRMSSDAFAFEIDLGHIDPIDTITGVQGRLLVLGYHCGDDDGVLGTATRQALFRFRKDNGLTPDGELNGVVRAKLQKVFGV